VTGEGYLDGRSLAGKVVGGVARLAGLAAVPVLVVAGDGDPAVPLPFVSLVERFGEERSWSMAGDCLREVVAERLSRGAAS
jgi:glycerate kinase